MVALLLQKYIRRRSPVWVPYLVASIFEAAKLFKGLLGYAMRRDWKLIRFLLRWALSKLRFKLKIKKPGDGRPKFCGAPGEFCSNGDKIMKHGTQNGGS
jgi:hypothetical protein